MCLKKNWFLNSKTFGHNLNFESSNEISAKELQIFVFF